MKIYKHIFCLCSLICGLQDVSAQPVNPDDPATVDITFSIFPLVSGNWEGIYYLPKGDPEKPEELRFSLYQRSKAYEYKGPAPLTFFRITTNDEGDKVFTGVGVVKLPKELTSGDLILFFDPVKEDGPYTITKMFDSEMSYPDESMVIFNTMPITFTAAFGSQAIAIPPGASPPISIKSHTKNPVPIAMAINQDNKLHLVLKNQMRFSSGRRTLLILRKPMNEGSLRIRSQRLTESSRKEEKESEG